MNAERNIVARRQRLHHAEIVLYNAIHGDLISQVYFFDLFIGIPE